ncbi:hypothetical protein [Streptomyces umbrinus]|uniref:hypothetical protein n=1 Tax=Streptomyces umbrinus TaxID=67370 RepID=UPI0033F17B8B
MTQISTTSRSNGFAIEVVDSAASDDVQGASSEAVGRITVGEFAETFRMDLSFWSVSEYRRSWKRALQVLAGDEAASSCLISSITDPENSNFVLCWPLYRSGEDVYVRNSAVFRGELDSGFDPEEPWHFMCPRR